jgi:hypothetical protein
VFIFTIKIIRQKKIKLCRQNIYVLLLLYNWAAKNILYKNQINSHHNGNVNGHPGRTMDRHTKLKINSFHFIVINSKIKTTNLNIFRRT